MMTEWVKMDWLKEQTQFKTTETIKKRILEPHREELESFVYYPKNPGEHWRFSRVHMQEWLRNNLY